MLIGRVAAWLGRGARTPVRNVLLSEATTPETYGRAFGFEGAMDSIGAVIGPLLSLSFVAAMGLCMSFALTIVPGVLSTLLIAALVKEREHKPQPDLQLLSGVSALPREFRRYLVGVGVAGLGDFSNTLLILWATQAWTPEFGLARAAHLAMMFYVGYNVIYATSCYISGHLADHFPKNGVLAIGYSVAVIPALALMSPGTSLVKFAIVFGFSGARGAGRGRQQAPTGLPDREVARRGGHQPELRDGPDDWQEVLGRIRLRECRRYVQGNWLNQGGRRCKGAAAQGCIGAHSSSASLRAYKRAGTS